MTPEKRIYDGNRAREILENPLFDQVFTDIEAEIINQWKSSPARAEADREKLWTYLSMLQKVRQTIQTALETGKLEMMELEHKKTMLDRLTSW